MDLDLEEFLSLLNTGLDLPKPFSQVLLPEELDNCLTEIPQKLSVVTSKQSVGNKVGQFGPIITVQSWSTSKYQEKHQLVGKCVERVG